MGWRDLLADEVQTIVAPFTGGRSLHLDGRTRSIEGPLPLDHNWYRFSLGPRRAQVLGIADRDPDSLSDVEAGFLVGNRFVPDDSPPLRLQDGWQRHVAQVYLLDEGLGRFARIEVGRSSSGGRLIYKGLAFPLGPEDQVLSAFLDGKPSIDDIKGVIPSLQAAFDLESYERDMAERRRLELQRLQRQEEEVALRELHRQELAESLGTGAGRREMAAVDFHSAARAALTLGGAELLDVHEGRGGEKVVRYRLDGRRYECICDLQMRIIDAGVCLTDEESGEKGDSFFTLESLPAVIRQADREGVLVVFRHV